jgi:hypothetical protein
MAAWLLSPFRDFGVATGCLYAVHRLLQRLSKRTGLYVYELMVQPISDEPLLPQSLAKNLSFREIKVGDPELERMPVPPAIRAARYAQGAVCLGAFQKGDFIGYIWFCFGAYEEDEVRCTYVLPPDGSAVFDFDLYVMPKYRLGVSFVGIWHGASKYLRERGVRCTFSRVTRFNLISLRSHAHLGWKRAGRATFLQLFKVEMMVASVRPFVSLSLAQRQRPRLKLKPAVFEAAKSDPGGRNRVAR